MAAVRGRRGRPMKSIFIDCNNELVPVFARVRRSDDPPIALNSEPFTAADLPRLLAGYDICLDDHSYLPTEVLSRCSGLRHIVFLGTGASSYMDVPALNALGIEVHTIKGYGDTAVAEHADGADLGVLPRARPHGSGGPSGHLGPAREHAAAWQNPRAGRARRHRPGSRADRTRHRHGGHRLESYTPAADRCAPGRARRALDPRRCDLAASRAHR